MMADTIISQYNADRPEWDRGMKLEGNIKIEASEFMITVTLNPLNSNEIFSFFLQTESNKANLLSAPPGIAQVIYLDRHLIINYLDAKRIYYFKMKADKKPRYLEAIGDMTEYTGYGLGMRKATGNILEGAPFCSCVLVGQKGNCPTGGVDELNCGVTNNAGSCKITCSGQAYACCDPRMN